MVIKNKLKVWYNEFVVWLYFKFGDYDEWVREDKTYLRHCAYRDALIDGRLFQVPVSREEFMNLYPPEGGPKGWKPECESVRCMIQKRQECQEATRYPDFDSFESK